MNKLSVSKRACIAFVFCAATAIATAAQTTADAQTAPSFTVLYSFARRPDGSHPLAPVIRDQSGNLYGTTFYGGPQNAGIVFRLDPSGHESIVYAFKGLTDGAQPHAGLTLDNAGNLFGTTELGGDPSCINLGGGCGTAFKLDPSGNETVLHVFTDGSDGGFPDTGVVLDPAGNLFGTALNGGSPTCNNGFGCGLVYKLDGSGNETVLFAFSTQRTGEFPEGGLVRGAGGNFYGTTVDGGNFSCRPGFGCGTVYKLDSSGNETLLYRFTSVADGMAPDGDLVRDSAGNILGVTIEGGDTSCNAPLGCGTVYKLDASGNHTVLHAFKGGTDGSTPYAGVIMDLAGNLYGTTYEGGNTSCRNGKGCGTIFRIDGFGHYALLHTFSGNRDGARPAARLLLDGEGQLYGTTYLGGVHEEGVVFKVSTR